MKIQRKGLLVLLALFACIPPAISSHLYYVSMGGRFKTTNETGRIIMKSFNHISIVRECAKKQDPPIDPRKLALVYDRAREVVAVLTIDEGRPVYEMFALSGGTSFATKQGTVRERQAFLFLEGDTTASGSLTGTERTALGTNNTVIRFNLTGLFQLTTPGNETNSPAIYNGSLVATRRFVPKNGDPGCTFGCPLPGAGVNPGIGTGGN